MKYREMMEKVRAGEITVELAGHCVNGKKAKMLKDYDRMVAQSNGSMDGKWNYDKGENKAETDKRMRDHVRMKLDMEAIEDEMLFMSGDSETCFGCGERLHWVLTGDKLQLRSWFDPEYKRPNSKFVGDWVNYPLDFVCPYATPKPTSGQINVSSRLIFANFFRLKDDGVLDCPKEEEHTQKWSLNHSAGIANITKYKSEHQNVAYGQMGNMSVGIFAHPNKKSIIVGNAYQDENDEENKVDYLINGHKFLGRISLDVWRWEATDFNTLGEKTYKEVVKENKKYRGMVEVEVEHGVWLFECYYETRTSADENIYAHLWLQ